MQERSSDSFMYHSPVNPQIIQNQEGKFTSFPHSSLVECCIFVCLVLFYLYTKIDSILNQFCLFLRLGWKKKAYINFLFLEPCEDWSFMPEPKYFSPVFFSKFRTGVSMEKVRTCNFFSPSAPKSIHTFTSLVQRSYIRWFTGSEILEHTRIGKKEHRV